MIYTQRFYSFQTQPMMTKFDAMTMAIHYMKESWRLTHPDDPYYENENNSKKRVAYWRV